jgi:hypothetical protein
MRRCISACRSSSAQLSWWERPQALEHAGLGLVHEHLIGKHSALRIRSAVTRLLLRVTAEYRMLVAGIAHSDDGQRSGLIDGDQPDADDAEDHGGRAEHDIAGAQQVGQGAAPQRVLAGGASRGRFDVRRSHQAVR